MKRVRPETWVCQLQPPRNTRLPQRNNFSQSTRQAASHISQHHRPRTETQWHPQEKSFRRHASTEIAVKQDVTPVPSIAKKSVQKRQSNRRIAKLSALHARLALPSSLPLNVLARCLIDASADSHPGRNNSSLAVLGRDMLGYYTTEHLMVHYPRLPMSILYAAQYAYIGPATLKQMRAEWGVELAAAPGPEVDRALLQFERVTPGNALAEDAVSRVRDHQQDGDRPRRALNYSKTVNLDEFGEKRSVLASKRGDQPDENPEGTRTEDASAAFIRAVFGAVYLHGGDAAAKAFHRNHILSRHIQLHKLFNFRAPTQDVNRLCHREGFELPVARLISETGRMTRSPVFVVGIFSGEDKLGEGAGASLNEGRVRAAAAAMRSWYLYSPPTDRIKKPSEVDGKNSRSWIPQMIDIGEIVT